MSAPPSPAECAQWLGIEPDDLEVLVEHPAVARAVITVREVHGQWHESKDFDATMRDSMLTPEQVFAKHDLPVVDPDGLDVRKLRLELDLMRTGDGRVVEERRLYGMTAGKLDAAENTASALLKGIDNAINLLRSALDEPDSMVTRESHLERRATQAYECLMQTVDPTWKPLGIKKIKVSIDGEP